MLLSYFLDIKHTVSTWLDCSRLMSDFHGRSREFIKACFCLETHRFLPLVWIRLQTGLWLTVSSPALAKQNGTSAPSTRFSETRNTSVMRFSKRLTPPIFLTRLELRTPASFHNIMLKEITKRLSQEKFICSCKKNWYADEWLRQAPMERNEATAATTASHRLLFVATAVRCSEEFTGTIAAASPSSGAALES